MERQAQLPRQGGAGDPAPPGAPSEDAQSNARNLLAAADRILDTLRPLNAEDYLQQNRQRGGE